MDITNVRSQGGIKHMSKAKRIFWGVMLVINIVALLALAVAVDNKSKNAPVYNYAPAKAEMYCDNEGNELDFDYVKNNDDGSYEIHATCPVCKQKWTIMYGPKAERAMKFIGE